MLQEKPHLGTENDGNMSIPVASGSVAAGTATYNSSSSSSTQSSFLSSSCCSQQTSKSRENEMDGGGGGSSSGGVGVGAEEDTALEKRASKSIKERHEQQRNLYRRLLIFHMGVVPLLLLLLLSLSAQQCSSEVVRLRHPDHLYYGDRGGGGGGSPTHSHRRNNIISMNIDNEDFLLERVPPEARLKIEEGEFQPSLSYHRKSHNSAVSSSSSSSHYKRKSHTSYNNKVDSDSNHNSNNNNNGSSSSSSGSSSDDVVGTNANSNEDKRPVPNHDGGETVSYFHHGAADPLQQMQQLRRRDAPENKNNNNNEDDTLGYVAMEDRELPVYFARQGNDGNQEVDQIGPIPPSTSPDSPVEEKEPDGKLFPPDLFTLEQRRQGAVVFYIIGVIYMFVALAIVCDEFFVPSLDVIIEFLAIQDDVAGATFMAAGGSAPELFTSVIGVFISKDDVGIGTIVGSAVFNILFVIGMCALFSRTILRLTWWPLFRDCSFYSIALITLIFFFRDSLIYWWEALILFSIYCFYVTFMKFNQTFERALKKLLFKNRVTRVSSTDQLVNNKSVNNGASSSQTSVQTVSGNQSSRGSATLKPPLSGSGRRNSIPMLHSGSKFRHGLLQLMIQSIDPLHDGRVDEKATQLHAIASLKALLDAAKTEADTTVTNNSRSKPVSPAQNPPSVQPSDAPLTTVDIEDQANGDAPTVQELAALQEAAEEGHEPLDISWPKGDCKKQISYILLFPIMICLFLTLPDTRTPRGKKFFAWGFLGSILWIAIFSYFMVWWADKTGETFGIAPEIMGLTFLAAGTSIPDLITSVIVARKGLGDMAVSSSVGSNIFDVCVGLPIPWLLYGLYKGEPVEVSAKGMLCSISILFGMLCFVVLSIMMFRWKMNKGLGLVMFVLYFIFLGVSLLFEYNVITCPRFLEA